MNTPNICLQCKGSRLLCGNKVCPLLSRIKVEPKIKNLSKDFFGKSPSSFIGHFGYPNVFIGPLGAVEEKENMDNPNAWFGMNYSDVIEMRSLLLRSKERESVFSKLKVIEEIQELTLANSPTDVEMQFNKKPYYNLNFSGIVQPMGPSVELSKLRLAENPKISSKIEYIVRDDLKAVESSSLLYKKGQDVYKITNILSVGLLGKEKKLVPTRWSITAIDDIICKQLIEEVKQYPSVNEYLVFSSEYLSNHFEILVMPGNWEFENFEAWAPGSFWSQGAKNTVISEEYEGYKGRTKYAASQVGGYYAARLGIVEGLKNIKRQARIVNFREIYEGYMIPLGVWVVRETVRNAFNKPPMKFSTLDEALKHIDSKLRIKTSVYKKKSRILTQKTINDFS